MQDDYAIQSFERAIAARDSGAFSWEIAPVRLLVLLEGQKSDYLTLLPTP